MGLLRDFKPSDGPLFEARVLTPDCKQSVSRARHSEPGNKEAPPYNIPDPPRVATHSVSVLQAHALSSCGWGKIAITVVK